MRNSKALLILAICFLGAAVWGGEIYDYWVKHERHGLTDWFGNEAPHHGPSGATNESNGPLPKTYSFSEIGIERTPCRGTCPVYSFIVKGDGTFRYSGMRYAEHKGEYTGTIPVEEFQKLSQFIKDTGFMEMQNNYEKMETDHSSVFTMVVADGKRKVIRNYADAGPKELHAIQEQIDKLMEKAAWNKTPDKK